MEATSDGARSIRHRGDGTFRLDLLPARPLIKRPYWRSWQPIGHATHNLKAATIVGLMTANVFHAGRLCLAYCAMSSHRPLHAYRRMRRSFPYPVAAELAFAMHPIETLNHIPPSDGCRDVGPAPNLPSATVRLERVEVRMHALSNCDVPKPAQ